MNQILLRSSKVTLRKCSRGAMVFAARSGSQNGISGNLSSIYFSRRYMSGDANRNSTNTEGSPFNVDAFGETSKGETGIGSPSLDLSSLNDGNAVDGLSAVAVEALPKINFFSEQIMNGIDMIHVFSGLPYWGAICVATVAIRIVMLPLSIKAIKNAAKMQHVKPEMEGIINRQRSDPNIHNIEVQQAYIQEVKDMYKRHGVHPASAFSLPLVQLPVFMSCFWALQDMGKYYPGFATGGDFWFTDLSSPDTTFILPIFNAVSFLFMIELGADGMQAAQAKQFQWIMRGLAIAMVPLTISMPQGLFVYWSCNNVLSLIQTTVLKNKSVKKFLEIPEPPVSAATAGVSIMDPTTKLTQALEKERAMKNSAKSEFLQGAVPPAPPSSPASFTMPSREERKSDSEKK